ncbi:MAG: cysteine hydrolase [Clostridiales bacterium]|nr:cysteine hydrolase [Clostridiales bacterium]
MKKLLVVIDYQNDFVIGSLGFEKAENLPICEKIKKYSSLGYEIVYTLDTHFDDYLSTQEGKNLPIYHCIKGTEGHKLYGEAKSLSKNAKIFEKNTFASIELAEYIKNGEYDSVELIGLVSNICVLSNAVTIKAYNPELPIIVDSKCTAAVTDKINEAALTVLRGLQIQII